MIEIGRQDHAQGGLLHFKVTSINGHILFIKKIQMYHIWEFWDSSLTTVDYSSVSKQLIKKELY